MNRFIFSVVSACWVTLFAGISSADVPWTLNFSGRLGSDVGDYTGSTDLTLTLYDDATSKDEANVLWADTMFVQVDEGRFQVLLGSVGNPLPSDAFVGPDLYLGIKVGADPEMTPRIQVASMPWAIRAGDAATFNGMTVNDFADANHTHDGIYYTEAEVDTALMSYAPSVHVHDDLYYGKSEVDSALTGKANADHHHDAQYVKKGDIELPNDGISKVSNQLITNVFTESLDSTDTPLAIADGLLGGVWSYIDFPHSGLVKKVSVVLDINHPRQSDLTVVLVSPENIEVTLHAKEANKTLSGQYPGDILPSIGDLDMFIGSETKGNWSLRLIDDEIGETGTLESWTLEIEYVSSELLQVNGELKVNGTAVVLQPGFDSVVAGKSDVGHTHESLSGPQRFGGDGSDGELLVINGQTKTLEANHVYNFSTVTIEPGGTLTISSRGILVLRASGNVNIGGGIDLEGMGSFGGDGFVADHNQVSSGSDGHDDYSLFGGFPVFGKAGVGSDNHGSGGGGGGNCTAGSSSPFSNEGEGGAERNGCYLVSEFGISVSRSVIVAAGAGGGGGGFYQNTTTNSQSGSGGAGGAGLVLEVRGDYVFSGFIDASGAPGEDGQVGGECYLAGGFCAAGGGGGGAGGIVVVMVNGLIDDAGTATVEGGQGGNSVATGSGVASGGGTGGNGKYIVIVNRAFQ